MWASPISLTIKSPIFVNKIDIRFKASIAIQKSFLLIAPSDENSNHPIFISLIVSNILATHKTLLQKEGLDMHRENLVRIEYKVRLSLAEPRLLFLLLLSPLRIFFVGHVMEGINNHDAISSHDNLRKNYCPSCLQYKDVKRKIRHIVEHARTEYDRISHCPDCGTTLTRKRQFFDIGGGD